MITKNIFVCKCGGFNVDRVACWSCGDPALPVSAKKASVSKLSEAPERQKTAPRQQKPPGAAGPTSAPLAAKPASGLPAGLAVTLVLVVVSFVISHFSRSPVRQFPPRIVAMPYQGAVQAAPSRPKTNVADKVAVPAELPPPQLLDAPAPPLNPPSIQTVERVGRPAAPSAATAPSAAAAQRPEPSNATDLQRTPLPTTSVIEKGQRRNRIAPLKIETEAGADYLLKLVSTADKADTIMIFVRGGETFSTKVPLGAYHVRGATGKTWYNKQAFFGPETHFFSLQNKDGKGADARLVARFWREKNRIFGMTLMFKNAIDGNMTQESIGKGDF
jgi:hypothetical protein